MMNLYKKILGVLTIMMLAESAISAPLLLNGAFEKSYKGRSIYGWEGAANNGANVIFSVEADETASNGKSLHIINNTALSPNVYGTLSQDPQLETGVEYSLICRARGKNARGLSFAIGEKWKRILLLPPLSEDWQDYSVTFTVQYDDLRPDFHGVLRLISEDVCDVWIDYILLARPGETPADILASTNEFSSGKEALETSLQTAYQEQLNLFHGFAERLSNLKKEFSDFYGESPYSAYIRIPLTILDDQLERRIYELETAEDAEHIDYEIKMAVMRGSAIDESLSDLETRLLQLRSGKKLPLAWEYIHGKTRYENGWPVSLMRREDGLTEERPVLFAGYGHFWEYNLERDIDKLSPFGANIIQIEIGPWHIFPLPGEKEDFDNPQFGQQFQAICRIMEKARKNNLKIALLISPHYFPEWALKKYSDAGGANGWMGYSLLHPKVHECLKRYIEELIPRIKNHPDSSVIHSITLTNEPGNPICKLDNPSFAADFLRYLKEKYSDIQMLNAVTQRNDDSFEAFIGAGYETKAVKYEFNIYKKEITWQFHEFLADEVHRHWADIPVSAKIMLIASTFDVNLGIDPEWMTTFSNYNGCDNYMSYHPTKWINNWQPTAMGNELIYSIKPISVVNTEHHIIDDSDHSPQPNPHIYTSIFQQFVSNASSLVTWLWAVDIGIDTYKANPHHVFLANISLRPGNLVAHAIALLDANRLSKELKCFSQYEPDAAFLYSPTSIIFSGSSESNIRQCMTNLYEEGAFTGHRVRFLSEQQLASHSFGNTKVLFITGATAITQQAATGMKQFTEEGGTIYADSLSLKENEYGCPLNVDFPVTRISKDIKAAELKHLMENHVQPLPVTLKSDDANGLEGILFRCVPDTNAPGNWLINIVNYDLEPRNFVLEGNGEFFDLIEDSPADGIYQSLPPLKPLLLRFTPGQHK